MLVIPAIDIRGGKCVRLLQGDYARETVFGEDPAAMARRWLDEGARALHLVDLDGAREGRSANRETVERVLAMLAKSGGGHVTTELGGGIRDPETIDYWLGAGLDRVVLGTSAVRDPQLVAKAARKHPGRIWVALDVRGGKLSVSGWVEDSDKEAVALAREMEGCGAAGIIYTDIDRDGTRGGVNVDATLEVAAAIEIPVYASGGVASVGDIRRLREASGLSVAGVIVGRALYEGVVKLSELIEAARRPVSSC